MYQNNASSTNKINNIKSRSISYQNNNYNNNGNNYNSGNNNYCNFFDTQRFFTDEIQETNPS